MFAQDIMQLSIDYIFGSGSASLGIKLKIIKKKRINSMKKKGVKHQNIIFAILFSSWT
jgi:hypothetical protein